MTLTKAEFVDRISGQFETKKAAADAVESLLDGITDVLAGGGDVNFTGFGKFSVAERGPRQGVNPRTGERITIAGGRVPKFSAGAGLKARVKG
jgi:nucleoid DNA-binding protein